MAVWLAALVYFWLWWLRARARHMAPAATPLVTRRPGLAHLLPLLLHVLLRRQALRGGPCAAAGQPRRDGGDQGAVRALRRRCKKTLGHAGAGRAARHLARRRGPAPETIAWCARTACSSPRARASRRYHRKTWPRRTRCKEGNLAYFYDHYGYERYDFVAQLDADHVPAADYLERDAGPFADPGVGYVSAPSICDTNAARKLVGARPPLCEAPLHGALQAGYNDGWAPLCIGSHYAVRTAALREIGGLGPELAEDHSTTLMMNAARLARRPRARRHRPWRRAATFADLVTQEFQWSRSLMTILLQYIADAISPSCPHG